MIYGRISDSSRYYAINEMFPKAFEFIQRAKKEELSVGRYEIDGDNLFAIIQEYDSKAVQECVFEAHRKHIDIQCVLSGNEIIEVADIADVYSIKEYSSDSDIEFFECNSKRKKYVLNEDDYCIFWSTDVHKPGICNEKTSKIKKIVVKVKE